MRLITYINEGLFGEILSQDVTELDARLNMFYTGRSSSDILCIAGGPRNKSMSLKTAIEFLPAPLYFAHSSFNVLMFELEVPEEEIAELHVKALSAYSTVQGDAGNPKVNLSVTTDKLDWLRSYYKDDVYHADGYVALDEAAWATLKYIRREWIVCIRKFVGDCGQFGDWTMRLEPAYVDFKQFPLWRGSLPISSHMRHVVSSMRNETYKSAANSAEYREITTMQDIYGMHGCPGYFTVDEALNCCNKDTKDEIRSKISKLRYGNKPKDKVTIQDIFGDSLIEIYDIDADKIFKLRNVFNRNTTSQEILRSYSEENLKTIYKYATGKDSRYEYPYQIVDALYDIVEIYSNV